MDEEGQSASEVEQRILQLYATDLIGETGVLHAVSVWRDPAGAWRVLAVDEATPASATDRFVLQLARARADAIVTTGRNLRAEPALTHAAADDSAAAALVRWRRERLDREQPPRSVVLTSGRDLDLGHPLFCAARESGAPPPLLWTGPAAAARLRGAATRAGLEVRADPEASIRSCVASLRDALDLSTVLVEAGPSTAVELYQSPCLVDELLLSVFEEPSLAPAAQGPLCADPAHWTTELPVRRSHASLEQSGRWRFERYTRAPW